MSDPRTADPLDRLLNLPGPHAHAIELPVLGIPVRFESSSTAVISAIEAEYGHWRSVGSVAGVLDDPRAVVRIDLADANTEAHQPAGTNPVARLISPRWVADDRISIETPDISAISDWTR